MNCLAQTYTSHSLPTYFVQLPAYADLCAWREAARPLLQAQVTPEQITWCSGQATDIFANAAYSAPKPGLINPRIGKDFLQLAKLVCCHSHPQRYALLYRLAWRLQQDKHLLDLVCDTDVWTAHQLAKQVGRESHKIKAFVRFRELSYTDATDNPQSIFIAWFEPQHYGLSLTADFFIRRFTHMQWAILTPFQSLYWDQKQLHIGLGAEKQQAPNEDTMEQLWLTYYRSTFNPARLKVNAMLKEMPRYYWKNLPEARLIPGLIAEANIRQNNMLQAQPTQAPLPEKTRFNRQRWLSAQG